jgi:hypothetical protein
VLGRARKRGERGQQEEEEEIVDERRGRKRTRFEKEVKGVKKRMRKRR